MRAETSVNNQSTTGAPSRPRGWRTDTHARLRVRHADPGLAPPPGDPTGDSVPQQVVQSAQRSDVLLLKPAMNAAGRRGLLSAR